MPNPQPNDSYTFRPIGIIHSPFKERSGTPIQGLYSPNSEGTIEVFNELVPGLADLDGFSHLHVVYAFHQRKDERLLCTPFLDTQPRGVFSTRAPCRPNPIGLSIVRLLKIDGNTLHIAELDMLDGSPLLDIKPYVPRFDVREDARTGWITEGLKEATQPRADDRFGE